VAEHKGCPPTSLNVTWPPGKGKAVPAREEPPVTTALRASVVPWTTVAGNTLALVPVGATPPPTPELVIGDETAAELLSSAGLLGVKTATISWFCCTKGRFPEKLLARGEHVAKPGVLTSTGGHRSTFGAPAGLNVTVPDEATGDDTEAQTQSNPETQGVAMVVGE
jgi:hypothetical protein